MTNDQIIAVCTAIKDCWTLKEWVQDFHSHFAQMGGEDAYFAHEPHMKQYRAAFLFSLISLRKVADFAENRGTKTDDINIADFGIDLHSLTGLSEVIDADTRKKINKGIAHLTTSMAPDDEEIDELQEVLESRTELLSALLEKFSEMIPEPKSAQASADDFWKRTSRT